MIRKDSITFNTACIGRERNSFQQPFEHIVLHDKLCRNMLLCRFVLDRHLAEIDQACNERMEIIVSAMAKREGVTEALKAADQMEWVCRMNNIRSRAEEIVLTELVYE